MGRHVNGATAAVNVVNWFFLVTAVLAVLMRLGTKYFFVRKITRDDWVLCLSLVRGLRSFANDIPSKPGTNSFCSSLPSPSPSPRPSESPANSKFLWML